MMAALVQMFVRFYTQCFAVQFLVSLWDLTAADGGGWRWMENEVRLGTSQRKVCRVSYRDPVRLVNRSAGISSMLALHFLFCC